MKRPSLALYFLEIPRAISERLRANRFLKEYTPEKTGNGHPVFVIPGFMASDTSTKPLRLFLNRMGFKAIDWGLGRNYGKFKNLDLLSEKIDEIYRENNQKITLIGWSLGGVYARELAKKNPESVKQIFTLGAPFAKINAPNNATWLFNLIQRDTRVDTFDPAWLTELAIPAPVPTTAIYTKTDGIVPWQACLEKKEDALHKNIEVQGSHCGLGVNKTVLKIIAEEI